MYGNNTHRSLNATQTYQDLVSSRVAVGRDIFCSGSCAIRAGNVSKKGVWVASTKSNGRVRKCPKCDGENVFTELVYNH